MTLIVAQEVEVGCRGQRITVRATHPENKYSDAEVELSLPLARELWRLLGKIIPIAERSQVGAEVVDLRVKGEAV